MNEQKAVGVFDNEADLEQALAQLRDHDWEDDAFDIIRQATDSGGVVPAYAAPAGLAGASGNPAAAVVLVGPAVSRNELNDDLAGHDLSDDEAEFYSNIIQDGGVILFVESEDEERAAEARQILNQANARTA